MSQRSHPVGYRPHVDPRHAGPASTSSGPRGCGCWSGLLIVLLAVFGGVAYLLVSGEITEEDLIALAERKLAEATGSAPPQQGSAPAAAGQVESTSGPRTAVLPSGQIIEGDFEIVSIEQHVAAGDFGSAMASAIENDPDALRWLLEEQGVDPDLRITYGSPDNWSHPLEKAVRQGSWETFQILLDAGADANGSGSGGETALQWAAYQGMGDTVAALLAHGADPDQLAVAPDGEPAATRWTRAFVGATPLEAAASRGHRAVVEQLLAAGAKPRYALHAAASSGSVEMIQLFLDRGMDPHQLDGFKLQPIYYANSGGHAEAIAFLRGL